MEVAEILLESFALLPKPVSTFLEHKTEDSKKPSQSWAHLVVIRLTKFLPEIGKMKVST